MRNFLKSAAAFIIAMVIVFLSGVFYGYKLLDPEQIIKEVEIIKTVDKIVYRDYSKADCCLILEKYDTTPMQINYKVNSMTQKYTNIDLTWKLYDRQGLENINIPVYQSGNWKFYTGITAGVIATAGISYLIMR